MNIFSKLLGDPNEKAIKPLRAIVSEINAKEDVFTSLSDEELAHQTVHLKERLAKGESLDDILPDAFATVREASKRVMRLRHYDVQLIGGMLLHKGSIAEMRTGEGKTLVATLPVYLNALSGQGVHVVTVNDYLARRDASWMGQLYSFLGLSVGIIASNESYLYDPTHKDEKDDEERDTTGSYKVAREYLRPVTRGEAYGADIIYGTNSEFGFDYLRDNLESDASKLRQRKLSFAVIDEIDSILIDEARTPLIISGPSQQSERFYEKFAKIVESFEKDADYTVDEKHRQVAINESGITKAEKALNIENLYNEGGSALVHHLHTALRAKALFNKDKEYVVRDGKVIIVDEFTGRLQAGRRWSDGLHQAVEAKERVSIEEESKTYASITYQNFFKLYEKLAGMTGTAMTSAEEFYKVYGLEVIAIPTNEPIKRIDHNDLIFKNELGKFKAIAKRVSEIHQKGQPVLIGTVSIEKNELLSAYLRKEGIPHDVLNAKNHDNEGAVIANAGKKGAVTIATNMAGRGVDIRLGGADAPVELYDEVKELGGLFVIGTERHEARRIDNQLRGRSGRQGDPGETQFFVSLEDDLMRVFANDFLKRAFDRLNISDDEPIQFKMITKALETAQNRIEGIYFDQRKNVMKFDSVLNTQRLSIYAKRRAILTGTDNDVDALIRDYCQTAGVLYDDVLREKQNVDESIFMEAVRRVALHVIDMHWMLHLEAMDNLRSAVNLRAYGQREPIVEYKREGMILFQQMTSTIAKQTLEMISKMRIEKK